MTLPQTTASVMNGPRDGDVVGVLWVRRKINGARAEAGLTWTEVAERLQEKGVDISAANLMTKNSRGSFSAVEFLLLMEICGVTSLALPVRVNGRIGNGALAA